jgi:hypothetical protein
VTVQAEGKRGGAVKVGRATLKARVGREEGVREERAEEAKVGRGDGREGRHFPQHDL